MSGQVHTATGEGEHMGSVVRRLDQTGEGGSLVRVFRLLEAGCMHFPLGTWINPTYPT